MDAAAAREVLGELNEGDAAVVPDGVAEEMIPCGAARVVAAKRRTRDLGCILVGGCVGEKCDLEMLESGVLDCWRWCWQGRVIYTRMGAVMASLMRWKAWLSAEARVRAKGACPCTRENISLQDSLQKPKCQAATPLLMCKATTTEAKPKRKVNGGKTIAISHLESLALAQPQVGYKAGMERRYVHGSS